MNEYDISRAFKRIENDLMDSMMRNMKKHQAEETELGIEWEQWQALQLKELERYRKENASKFTDDFSQINKKVEAMFQATCNDAQSKQENYILEQIKKGDFTPTQTKDTQFFNLNDKKLDILIERTKADFTRAEYAMLRKADDVYRQTIFDAQVYASVTNDYAKAVDMATHDFLKKGIQCVTYSNGAKHTISDYAEMCVRTGNKRAYLMGEGNAHDKYGIHTVRVNKRTQACPKCVGFLGRVLVDDVYCSGTAKEASELGVPTLSSAIQAGFLHPNCKDIYSLYIPDVSRPATPWTQAEINEIVGDYNKEQAITHAVAMAESYRRLSKYALDPTNAQLYGQRAQIWEDRITQIEQGQYVGAPQVQEVPTEPVAPIYHEGMRSFIPVEYDEGSLKGIYDVDGINIEADGNLSSKVTLSKSIKIPWNDLTDKTQNDVRWYASQRMGKDFIIRPQDMDWVWNDKWENLTLRRKQYMQKAIDNGYNYIGYGSYLKYNHYWRYYLFEKDGKISIVLGNIEENKTVSKSTLDKIKDRSKVVSKKLWDKGVHFKDLTVRQGDEWVDAMTAFHTATEADKPITLVSKEAYDKIKGEELYRGIAPVSHLRGDISMTKTPMQCAEQLMLGGVGDCFPSRGVYGDVVAYLSNSTQTGFNYATGYGRNAGGCIVRMKIKEDAKVISYEDAKDLFNAVADSLGFTKEPYFSRNQRRLTNNVEVGKAMQMLGYDVIFEEYGDGANVHFYMVLNRDALVAIKDDWVTAEITDAMIRRGHI